MSVQIQDQFKEKKNKVVVKVGMLGDSQIGKTTLMVKYIEDKYDEDYIETLGVNFMEKTIQLKNVDVTISIWDLGGQREFATLMPLVCSDAKVILFAFDLTQKQSLFSIKRWYKEARKENKVFLPFLIGTKFDLFEELENHHKTDIALRARKFAKKMGAPLIYCSSAESINIKKIFKVIIAKVFNLKPKIEEQHNAISDALVEIVPYENKDKKKKKGGDDGDSDGSSGNADDGNTDDAEKRDKKKKKKKKKKKHKGDDGDDDGEKKKKKKKKKKDKKKKKKKHEEEDGGDSEENDDDSKEEE